MTEGVFRKKKRHKSGVGCVSQKDNKIQSDPINKRVVNLHSPLRDSGVKRRRMSSSTDVKRKDSDLFVSLTDLMNDLKRVLRRG